VTTLEALKFALAAIESGESFDYLDNEVAPVLREAIEEQECSEK
jgi:hypothetical protein